MAELYPRRHRVSVPTHPGEFLREDVLPNCKVSITEAARKMHISRQSLHAILACNASVSPEMAVRFGKFFGNGPGLWLRMQAAHDLWHAEQVMADELQTIETLVA